MKQPKPFGITIVAISYVVCGIVGIAVGLLCFSLRQNLTRGILYFSKLGFSVPIWEALSVMSIVWGLVLFLGAFGLFKGKSWAFTVTFVVSLLGMVFPMCLFVALQDYTVLSLAVALAFSIPNGMVFVYLYRKNVMVFFYEQEQALRKRKPPPRKRGRPLGVTIVAILTLLSGIGGVAGGLLYVGWGRILERVFEPMGLSVYPMFELWGAVLIAASLVSFLTAYGLLKKRRWGYWLAFAFNSVGWFFGGFFTAYQVDHFSLGFLGIILFFTDFLVFLYLTVPLSARKFFGIGRKSLATMSKGERRGVLSEIEDMLRVNMTNEEIKEQFRHLLTDAEIEELIESLKATLPKPKEEQTSLNKNS